MNHDDNSNRVLFYVTGFGPFGPGRQRVERNPSQVLVEALAASSSAADFAGVAVLRVSAAAADAHVAATEAAALAALRAASAAGEAAVAVFLHFGVAGDATGLEIESRAANDCAFRIPDEDGCQPPAGSRIDGAPGAPDALASALPAAMLARAVRAAGHRAAVSSDAGNFLCNYLYHGSLRAAARVSAAAPAGARGGWPAALSLFVHVPPAAALPPDALAAAARALVSELAALLRGGASAADAARGDAEAAADASLRATARGGSSAAAAGKSSSAAAAAADAAAGESRAAAPALPADAAARLAARLVDLGFPSARAAAAAAAVGARSADDAEVELAVTLLLSESEGGGGGGGGGGNGGGGGDSRAAASRGSPSPPPSDPPDSSLTELAAGAARLALRGFARYKLVIVVRSDLHMSVGKTAAQACHGALKAARAAGAGPPAARAALAAWRAGGEPIVVLRAPDLRALDALAAAAAAAGVPAARIADAGRTEVAPGSVTVLAVGPAAEEDVDAVTGELKLL